MLTLNFDYHFPQTKIWIVLGLIHTFSMANRAVENNMRVVLSLGEMIIEMVFVLWAISDGGGGKA